MYCNAFRIAIFIFAHGLILLVFYGGPKSLTKRELPDFSRFAWWQSLGAPIVVGAVALLAKATFQPVQKYVIDTDRQSHPLWERGSVESK